MHETWSQTVDRYIAEGRTVSGGKGDQIAKQAEVQQYAVPRPAHAGLSAAVRAAVRHPDFLKNRLQPMIDNPTGYSDAAKAAMKANATDEISGQYDNATKGFAERPVCERRTRSAVRRGRDAGGRAEGRAGA
jgi:hypothetical protein